MSEATDVVRNVVRFIKQHRNKIVCRAVMWDAILDGFAGHEPRVILDALSADDRRYLRAVYDEFTPSLHCRRPEDDPILVQLESWCQQSPANDA